MFIYKFFKGQASRNNYVNLVKVKTKRVERKSLTFVGPAKGKLTLHEISLGLNFKF
jgi:hypothetical protein